MLNLPNTPVFNKIATNNARIAPDSTTNNTVIDHKNFSMLHPQRASENILMDVLNQLDLTNPSKSTNGVIKGNMKDGSGSYMITPGVIKFHKGGCQQPPPPPVCDTPPTYVAPPTYGSSDTPTTPTYTPSSDTTTYPTTPINYSA